MADTPREALVAVANSQIPQETRRKAAYQAASQAAVDQLRRKGLSKGQVAQELLESQGAIQSVAEEIASITQSISSPYDLERIHDIWDASAYDLIGLGAIRLPTPTRPGALAVAQAARAKFPTPTPRPTPISSGALAVAQAARARATQARPGFMNPFASRKPVPLPTPTPRADIEEAIEVFGYLGRDVDRAAEAFGNLQALPADRETAAAVFGADVDDAANAFGADVDDAADTFGGGLGKIDPAQLLMAGLAIVGGVQTAQALIRPPAGTVPQQAAAQAQAQAQAAAQAQAGDQSNMLLLAGAAVLGYLLLKGT